MLLRTLAFLAAAVPAAALAAEPTPLPHGVTSLGAAATENTVYLYGGHMGPAHHYNTAMQSGDFRALDLTNPTEWKTLPSGPKLQGLALAAHDGKIYRLGGFTAVNAKGEDEDLQSQAGVAVYDPAKGSWEELTSLPEPRSSFDAAVLGDRVYIIGGWTLGGGQGSGQWLKTAWSADLTQRPLEWEPVAEPPFERRAVAVEAYGGEIYVIGGMGDGKPTRRMDVFNPQTKQWRRGPDLLGKEPIDGFGVAAVGTESGLYVSSLTGTVQRLTKDAAEWEVVAELKSPRFFHQMIAHGDELWLVGGANMVEGKLQEIEVINLTENAAAQSTDDNRTAKSRTTQG